MTDYNEDWLTNVGMEGSKKLKNDSSVVIDGKVKVKEKMNTE
jgi:hypothetical protein